MVQLNCNGPTGVRPVAPTPDISPAGVPVVSANVSNTATTVPGQLTTFFQCTPGHTIMDGPEVSVGDVGIPAAGGIPDSHSQNVTCDTKVILTGRPATKNLNQTIPDFPVGDGLGSQVGPSQPTTMSLAPVA